MINKAEIIRDKKLLEQVVNDDAEGFHYVTEDFIEKTRWHELVRTVFKRESDGKLFMAWWRRAATEYQDSIYPDFAYECEPYTETVTKYRRVKA